ncbi:MAG: metalloregulator ArsR/SmtB family transcription factor [Bacteroidetes bacterium]|nr:metalloregulator ArsR/SmtB family transcription factor [Bacteroidota bacterium]MBU1720308.1 metalloregulator ArsR/SmtB family transcription factor [Bacteroidota bacterium]
MSDEVNYTELQNQLSRFARAMGHPARIQILELLIAQSCCFSGDIAKELPIARSTVSQHLNELKDAGLIQGEINPPNVKYCISRANWELAKSLFYTLFEQTRLEITDADCAS